MYEKYSQVPEFKNEPFTNFQDAQEATLMKKALAFVGTQLGRTYSAWIGGNKADSVTTYSSINPANKKEIIGIFPSLGTKEAEDAVTYAWKTYASWSKTSPHKRADFLFRAAHLMRQRKHEFSAWMIHEVGKTWAEADADTAEAIDFMEFYAREMLRLNEPQPLTKIPGENNQLTYIPLGVGAVIPPWNFPLAICVGMTTAAVVSGNTVILKPSEDSPTVAYKFFELMQEVGLPSGVIQFLTGPGSIVGEYLVNHPRIRFISFTGSKQVGLRINELAAKTQPGQIWIKRVVAEMGGKDAMLIDNDVSVDAAAQGIVAAAFGFQGQKCSACSRAIIHEDIYQKVLDKVVELTSALTIGNPAEATTQIGPVINQKAFDKISSYIQAGKDEGELVYGGTADNTSGYFITPTIFSGIQKHHKLFQEEIFGPVVAFTKVKSFKEGLELVNATEFGLTGAAYSNRPEHLEMARQEFHVGNLYLNRKCTGALVGVHPFGGFNMSGTDSKAGGHDYLLLFTQAKLISEKISL